MGLLENIVARSQWMPTAGGFPGIVPPIDEAALAADARDAAGRKLVANTRKRPPNPLTLAPDAQSAGVQLAMDNAPEGTGVPFSTQAGMLAPPITIGPPADSATAPPPPSTIPLPMTRPTEADLPGATDVSAASRQPMMPANLVPPPSAPPMAVPPTEPSMFGRLAGGLMSGLSDNSNALLAIGAGFAGAPNIGQGISRASAAMIPAHAADVKQRLTQQAQTYGTKALIDAGVPVQQAIAAAGDPDLKKALIKMYIEDRKSEIKSVKSKDAFGNETERLYSINPFDNSSKEITLGGTGGAGGAAAGGKNASFAAGITPETFDHAKVGNEYLAQFSPEIQAGVKAYLRGDSLPTGRQQQAQVIKQVAQKYGDDTGVPANDQAYFQRKNFVTSLGDTKSGIGLQTRGFQQGLEHMQALADKLVKLKNSGGLGLEPIAEWTNWLKNMTTSQRDIVNGVGADSQALAGEVGKLFSGQSGGGVRERHETQQRLGNPNMSGPAAAGALEATMELMMGGLRPLEQRRNEIFGNDPSYHPKGSNFVSDAQRQQMEHIRRQVATLRGASVETAAAPASSVAAPAPVEPTAINKQTGQRMILRGGQWQPLQ